MEVATVGLRFGHSQVAEHVYAMGPNAHGKTLSHRNLAASYFMPMETVHNISDDLLRGSIHYPSQAVDLIVVDALRQHLFSGGDLITLDLQRGRDHGLPDYISLRKAYGLDVPSDFSDISTNVTHQAILASLYPDIKHIDPLVGALAEDLAPGSSVGPLIKAILVNEFYRLRAGDAFWYDGCTDALKQN